LDALRLESKVDVEVSSSVPFAVYCISCSLSKLSIEEGRLGAITDKNIIKVRAIDSLDLCILSVLLTVDKLSNFITTGLRDICLERSSH
jgi:hypothetical protein